MSYLMAAVLGLIQGVSEFLPISSSGHLSVVQNLFGVENAGGTDMFFNVLLHLATLFSVCIVYRKDIAEMIHEFFGFFYDMRHPSPRQGGPSPARRLVLMIIIGTLPLFIILPFKSSIELLYNNTFFIGFAFLFTGTMLYISDRLNRGKIDARTMTIKNALVIGACQAVAVLPGVSRSGSTITAGLATGLERSFAVKYAFLLSLPAIIGANILELSDAFEVGIDWSMSPKYLLGMVCAGVSGYFCIGLVRFLSKSGNFGKFCYYCFLAGILTIVLSFAN